MVSCTLCSNINPDKDKVKFITSYTVMLYNTKTMLRGQWGVICVVFQRYEMKSILSFNGNTFFIQGYQTFCTMCIYTIFCDLVMG